MQPRKDEDLKGRDQAQAPKLTQLGRTQLDDMQKVEMAAQALGRAHEHGAMSDVAREFCVSRPTVYAARSAAANVLAEHFDERAASTVWVPVDDAHLRRAVVALRVMAPNALRPIEELIPLLFPGVRISYGTVQKIAAEAEQRAAEYNAGADLSNIEAGALDEMYSQGQPVLAGVDLDSGYLFSLALKEHRGAQDWADVLRTGQQQGLDLKVVVKDAALGIAAGVREVFPDAQQRDDCFHAHYEMGKARRVLEQQAYGAIAREQEVRDKLARLRRSGKGEPRESLVAQLHWAKRRCSDALELHDEFECAMLQAQEAMEFVDLDDGKLRTAEHAQASIERAAQAMQSLDHKKCSKVGKYIENRAPGLAMYMTQLLAFLAPLSVSHGESAVALASVIWRLLFDLKRGRRLGTRTRRQDQQQLIGALAMLRSMLGVEQADELVAKVHDVFERRHRASSAIEGFNAALRPFLYVHKGVTSGFLELFRARYNLRRRRWGRHRGTQPVQCLTGERVDDWLCLLGYPPSSTVASRLH